MVCGILVPQPGIEPGSSAVRAQILTGQKIPKKMLIDIEEAVKYSFSENLKRFLVTAGV